MCGIEGFFMFSQPSVQLRKQLRDWITAAMYVGAIRGQDATGLFAVARKTGACVGLKKAVEGHEFVNLNNVDRLLFDVEDYSVVVAHNRKGTLGGTDTAAAHPFKYEAITLVHNGTIQGHRVLSTASRGATVDSDGIARALATKPAIEVLESIQGAFTLVWHDSRDGTVNIAKNKDRPLALSYITGNNGLLMTSEAGMLRWLAGKYGIELQQVVEPKPFVLYSWQTGKDARVRAYTETPFEELKQSAGIWEGYDDYGMGYCGHDYPAQGVSTASNASVMNPASVKSSKAAGGETTKRLKREKVLEKFSMAVGDIIQFVPYAVTTPAFSNSCHDIIGCDEGGQFETLAYSNNGDSKWVDSLCTGKIVTVKDTSTYDDWPIIIVSGITIVKRDYYTKNEKSAEDERPSITVAKSGAPSDFCTEDAGMCLETCMACSKMEDESMADAIDLAEEQGEFASTVVDLTPTEKTVAGPGNKQIPEKEWTILTQRGCAMCSCNLLYPSTTYWTPNSDPLCEECFEDIETMTSEVIH